MSTEPAAAQTSGTASIDIRLLQLSEGNWSVDPDSGLSTSSGFTLKAEDVVSSASGVLDRAATLLRIAQRAYPGFNDLGEAGRKAVLAYVDERLPTDAAQVKAGTTLNLAGFISVKNNQVSGRTWQTDYSIRRLGADGIPGGSTQNHVVRTGETLQSIAATYFGSPSYWYLIADANGLQGTEALSEGTVLTIPNAVANSVNDSQTFKVYNENEIIGSTSPEVRTIPKKKKWYQKLVMILVVVIMIVAAVLTAGAALAAMGAATPGLLSIGAGLASAVGATGLGVVGGVLAAAAMGAAIYSAANLLTQGLMIAAKLQDGFSWKSLGKAALSGAVSGAATAIGAQWGGTQAAREAGTAVNWTHVAVRVGVEAGKQLILDGKINNVSGLIGAAVGAGAAGDTLAKYNATLTTGLSILEKRVRRQDVSALDWVNLANAGLGDASANMKDSWISGQFSGHAFNAETGKVDWKTVALQTVGLMAVRNGDGEDAALNYLGSSLGGAVVDYANFAYRDSFESLNQRVLGERNRNVTALTDDPFGDYVRGLGSALGDAVVGSIQQGDQQRQAEAQKRQELYGPNAGNGEGGLRLSGAGPRLSGMSGDSTPGGMSPDQYQAQRQDVEDQIRLDVLGQEARDDSLNGGQTILTGGAMRSMPRAGFGSGGFEMVRNNNWDAALNIAADPLGILGEMAGLQQDLAQLNKAKIEGQLNDMRQKMISAGVKDVPTGYVQALDTNGNSIRDYQATAGQLNQTYENHVRDQRLRETWGDDYQNIRIGKSQMTVQEFEKRNLDIHMQATDRAYEQGVDAIARGQLVVKDGDYAKTLGNFIDVRVRDQLRGFAKAEGINDSSASNIWAINRRIKSEMVPGWGIPDSRLGANVYADTTLARKNAYTPQIMKWNDIRPGNMLIIRPTQLGGAYAIPRISIPQQPRSTGRGI